MAKLIPGVGVVGGNKTMLIPGAGPVSGRKTVIAQLFYTWIWSIYELVRK